MILEAIEKVLASHCTGAEIRRIEEGGDPAPLWLAVQDAGFLDLCVPEDRGGAALSMNELFAVLQCLGRFAMPLPLAHTMVARAIVGGSANMPAGMVTLVGQLRLVGDGAVASQFTPYGAVAEFALANHEGDLWLLPCALARRVPLGEPRHFAAGLTWDKPQPLLCLPGAGRAVEPFAAAMTAALLSGAMQRSFDMALEHCNQRVQFGKPLSKFQAIQQQLSVMAEHVLAGAIAAEAAFPVGSQAPTLLSSAVAKSRTSEAAALVASIAHAVHGAMGITDECDLGLVTRRLHDWRISYGAEDYWNRIVGASVLADTGSLAEFVRAI